MLLLCVLLSLMGLVGLSCSGWSAIVACDGARCCRRRAVAAVGRSKSHAHAHAHAEAAASNATARCAVTAHAQACSKAASGQHRCSDAASRSDGYAARRNLIGQRCIGINAVARSRALPTASGTAWWQHQQCRRRRSVSLEAARAVGTAGRELPAWLRVRGVSASHRQTDRRRACDDAESYCSLVSWATRASACLRRRCCRSGCSLSKPGIQSTRRLGQLGSPPRSFVRGSGRSLHGQRSQLCGAEGHALQRDVGKAGEYVAREA